MSEDYKIQANPIINGDMFNIRAGSAEELKGLVKGLAVEADEILSALVQFKQAVIAKDIFTGGSGIKGNQGAASTKQARVGANGNPVCDHGEMLDLRHKNYKADYYCPQPKGQPQCSPVKL